MNTWRSLKESEPALDQFVFLVNKEDWEQGIDPDCKAWFGKEENKDKKYDYWFPFPLFPDVEE